MKFTVKSSDFVRSLGELAKVIPSKPVIGCLSCIRTRVEGDELTLTVSDAEVFFSRTITLESGSVNGECLINSEHLLKLAPKLPACDITVESVDNSVTVDWRFGRSVIPTDRLEDYPAIQLPDGDKVASVSFNSGQLLKAVSGTLYATADDEIRPALCGLLFDIGKDSSRLVGTDAKKLAMYGINPSASSEQSFILHKKVCGLLRNILSKTDENDIVVAAFDDRHIRFSGESFDLCALMITHKFPNYKAVVDIKEKSTLTVDRKELLEAVSRVKVCASKATSSIKLRLDDRNVRITAMDVGYNVSAEEDISAELKGEPMKIVFNGEGLEDVLSNLTCTKVLLRLVDPRHGVLLSPTPDEDIPEGTMLMPLAEN